MDVLKKLNEIVKNMLKREDENLLIDENTNLSSLGLNSFERIDLICALEEEFNLSIPDEKISEFEIVKDIVSFIDNILNNVA